MRVTLGTYFTSDAIRAAVNSVLDSGRLSYGEVSRLYETSFAKMHECQYGVVSNSGTSSLVVALQAMKELYGWHDGDEVIVPALTFVATVNAVLHNNLKPVLVDVNPLTFNIDPDIIEQAITTKTRCIIPVHLFGRPAEMFYIREIAYLNGLKILEDSCETIGTSTGGKSVGSWGDIGCFSTYAAHHLVTGVGGMATTNDEDLAEIMRSLVNHGIDLSELPMGREYDPSWLSRKFRFTRVGHSFRITELEAAIGVTQLSGIPKSIERRQQNAMYLTNKLMGVTSKMFLPVPHHNHTWMVYPLVLVGDIKWPLMNFLNKHGIECREMVPLTNQPCYNFKEWEYPVADHINQSGFYIGIHQDLTEYQLDYVTDVFVDWFEGELNAKSQDDSYASRG